VYFNLIKRTKFLEDKVLTTSFTVGNQNELFSENSKSKESDPDYSNTFI